jgi:hypothetical protein
MRFVGTVSATHLASGPLLDLFAHALVRELVVCEDVRRTQSLQLVPERVYVWSVAHEVERVQAPRFSDLDHGLANL